MNTHSHTDICVLGAGPAGSAIAKRLCDLGFSVCILEKLAFPRPHVGICLSDPTLELLAYLGVKEAVDQAGFLRRKVTVLKWGTEEPTLTPQPGIHVDRGLFDQLLLENARRAGATVLQPARVTQVQAQEEGGWQVEFDHEGRSQVLQARLLVDAAGKSNVLPSKREKCAPPLFAVHATWELAAPPPYDGFMEAGEDAWLWMAELKEGRAMVSLYTDPKHFSESPETSLEQHYFKMLGQFTLLRHCALRKVIGEVQGCDASSRHSTDPVGRDYIRIGDAHLSVDPMAAQGVHLALSSGLQAAMVVNTLLRYPAHTDDALAFYRSRHAERIQQFTKRSASVYAQVAQHNRHAFWQERSIAAPPEPAASATTPAPRPIAGWEVVRLCAQARIQSVPVVLETHIVGSPALHHPALDRPVAFLGGQDLVALLADLGPGDTADRLRAAWSDKLPAGLAGQIFQWLWERGILVAGDRVGDTTSQLR